MDETCGNRSDNNITKIHIQTEYTRMIDYKIDCDLTQVDKWYIRYGTLYIVLKDGTVKQCEGDSCGSDYKYPERIIISDGDDFDDDNDYETIMI